MGRKGERRLRHAVSVEHHQRETQSHYTLPAWALGAHSALPCVTVTAEEKALPWIWGEGVLLGEGPLLAQRAFMSTFLQSHDHQENPLCIQLSSEANLLLDGYRRWGRLLLLNLLWSGVSWLSSMRILAATSRVTILVLETRNSITNFWLIILRDLSFRLLADAKKEGKQKIKTWADHKKDFAPSFPEPALSAHTASMWEGHPVTGRKQLAGCTSQKTSP